eukprot:1144817-Pelagomonas_calceolata.AAC.1
MAQLSSNHVRAHGMIVVGGQRRGGPHVPSFGRPLKNIPSEASSTLLSITERLLDGHTRDKAAGELRSLSSREHAGEPIIEWEHGSFWCFLFHQPGRGHPVEQCTTIHLLQKCLGQLFNAFKARDVGEHGEDDSTASVCAARKRAVPSRKGQWGGRRPRTGSMS